MTIWEFAEYIAKKTDAMVARRFGVTRVEASGSPQSPVIHIVNKDFNMDRTVPAEGPYEDFETNKETQADTYAEALAFEIEYALFDDLILNHDLSKYKDFNRAGEKK